MFKKFFFLLVIGIISVQSLTIGSCVKYSSDGQACLQCIPNYHLYEGGCYVDIIGCVDYKFGNICHQCDNHYILVNNLCCDQICMNKLFSKFKSSAKQEVISSNSQILALMIPFAQENFIKESNARLVAIQLKDFENVKRFFFLYEFYSTVSNYYERRLVLDYIVSSKKIVPVDWSEVRNSWQFAVIQWTEVEDDTQVLTIYPSLYKSENVYNEIVVRKAVCNLVEEYEIATKLSKLQILRILYQISGDIIILSETSKTIQLLEPVSSGSTNPTSGSTDPSSSSTDPSTSGSSTTPSVIEQPVFVPYQIVYKGFQIEQALKINTPLQAAIKTVQGNEKFNHLLTLIEQKSSVKGIIQFEVVGQNKSTGSIIRFVLQYNSATGQVTIISINEQFIQVEPVIVPIQPVTPVTPTEPAPTVIIPQSRFDIVQQGCTSHSFYFEPLNKQMSLVSNEIKGLLGNEIAQSQNTANPIVLPSNLVFRRLVITEAATGINWKQAAYVQHDPSNPNVEYFSYFVQRLSPVKEWFFMGMNEKTQTSEVYNKPQAYPLFESDPSFVVYPQGKFFHVETVPEQFIQNLNDQQRELVIQLNALNRTEIDRKFNKVNRFAIDMIHKTNTKRYKAIGYNFLHSNSSIPAFASFLAENNIVDENTPSTTTEVTTNILGHETIKTDNIAQLLKDDAILVMILKLIESEKPIILGYGLIEVDITEYAQSLQYTLIFHNKNINGEANFQPSSQVVAVAIHDKNTHANKLISFELTQLKPITTDPSSPSTVDPSNPSTNPSNPSTVDPSSPSSSGSQPTHIAPVQPSLPEINQADRIKQLIDNLIIQLQDFHKLVVPDQIDISQKVDTVTGTVLLTLVFKDQNGQDVVVTATGDLKNTDPAVILQIKKVTPQVVEQIVVPPTAVVPTESPVKPTQPESSLVSQPSPTIVDHMQNKPYEQTTQVDGQIRKIKINPDVTTLQEQLKAITCEINDKDQLLRKSHSSENATQIKFLSIELAATSISIQYAIVIKSTFLNHVEIRRYFVVKQLTNNKSFFMGYEELPANFDPFKVQNRYFKSFVSIPKDQVTVYQLPKQIISGLNTIKSTQLSQDNIETFNFRAFPLGSFVKCGIVTQGYIALAYTLKQQSNIYLFKWDVSEKVSSSNTGSNTGSNPTDSSSGSTTNPTDSSSGSSSGSTTNPTDSSSSTSPSTPAEVITGIENNNQIKPVSPIVVIELTLQQKLEQVLRFVSDKRSTDLTGAQLTSEQNKQNINLNGKLQSIQFSLYFTKDINEFFIRQFFVTVVRLEDGTINIISFEINDIQIKPFPKQPIVEPNTPSTQPSTQPSTSPSTTPSTTPSTQPTTPIKQDVVEKQQQTNSNLVIVDPNEILYSQALQFINKDSQRKSDDIILDLKSIIPEQLNAIVKYIRAKYVVVHSAKILAVVQVSKTESIIKYRIYFFKQVVSGSVPTYQIFKCVIQYQKLSKQTRFNVITFELFVDNNQLTSVKDLSRQDDTDVAFGYSTIQLDVVPQDKNVQNVLNEINKRYKDVVSSLKLAKVEFLQLKDGRLNYKILFTDSTNSLQTKFIIFYQPTLQKVLVLNSVNLPNHAQYIQLSTSEQESDRILSSVIQFVNELHSELVGFSVKSVSKAVVKTEHEYSILFEKKDKKYRSIVRIAENNVDMTEIKFTQLAEISLDHYRLDQFDQIFIMNYQKLTEEDMRTDSKFRMALNYLYMNNKISSASLLGAASKVSGLGHIYKVYLRIGQTGELFVAEIYLEAFSNKISIKSYNFLGFESNFVSLSLQETAVTKIINYLKSKNQFTQFTVKSAEIKDFLFGSLYKLTFANQDELFNVYVYHDHSSEEVNQLFNKVVRDSTDQCSYEGATCVSCKNTNFRVSENKCVEIISNCVTYTGDKCSICKTGSKLFNGICISESQCGALCNVVSV